MPRHRIHHIGAVWLAVTILLAAASARASDPAASLRHAADTAEAKSRIAYISFPRSGPSGNDGLTSPTRTAAASDC